MQDNVLANPWQSEKKYPVDISNTELSPLACRGSKGQTPMASLGTAQRLAPVQSGLPLCETCLSSPHHWTDTYQAIFSTLRYQIKMEMTVVLWCRNWLWKKKKNSPSIDFLFLKQAVHASLRYEVSDNPMPYPALYSFLHLACSIHPSTNAFLLYFPVISVFLFLDLFPFLLKDIIIAVVNIPLIFTNRNAITAIVFFCYSVFVNLFLTVSLFSCYCYFITI